MQPMDGAMETCKTCKNWKPKNGNFQMADQRRNEGEGGLCSSDKLCENWGPTSYQPDALVYPYSEGAEAFWTGPDFGCVHHQKA